MMTLLKTLASLNNFTFVFPYQSIVTKSLKRRFWMQFHQDIERLSAIILIFPKFTMDTRLHTLTFYGLLFEGVFLLITIIVTVTEINFSKLIMFNDSVSLIITFGITELFFQ